MNTVTNSKLKDRLAELKKAEGGFQAPEQTKVLDENDVNAIASQLMATEPSTPESDDSPTVIVANERAKSTPSIVIEEPTEEVASKPNVGDELFDLETIKSQSENLSKELETKQEKVLSGEPLDEEADEPATDNTTEVVDPDEEVSHIIDSIADSKPSTEENLEIEKNKNKSIEDSFREFEESKLYSTYEPNEEVTGPAAFIVETDEVYARQIADIAEGNNIRIAKVSGSDKMDLLNRYTNSGDKVTVALPNSGIYVKMSGAGVDELISMSTIETDNAMTDSLNKLGYVNNHIVDTSVGPLKLQQLIDIVSYYDIPTLYYGLFAATHPTEVEISRICPRCSETYFVKMNTRDLLLNYKEFEKSATDIRDNVTTYKRLMESSKLAKVYKHFLSNGMVIYYKHPSIRSFLVTYYHLTQETISRFNNLTSFAFCIDKIAIPDTKRSTTEPTYVEFTDPNEIITILSRLKNPDDKYEINDVIESVRPGVIPSYGYHSSKCPHCGNMNEAEPVAIDSLLFTIAREDDTMASVKRAILEERKKNAKLQKSE